MDLLPMGAMPGAADRCATSPQTSAKAAGSNGFGAALTAAQAAGAALDGQAGDTDVRAAVSATEARRLGEGQVDRSAGGAAFGRPTGPDAALEAAAAGDLQTALAGALGLNGAIVHQSPRGGPVVPVAPRGLQVVLAAQGFASLQRALQGPVSLPPGQGALGPGLGEGGEGLVALEAGARQSGMTQELAHLLAQRHGPLPGFGGTEAERAPNPAGGAAPFVTPLDPEMRGPASETDSVAPAGTQAAAAPTESERPVTGAAPGAGLVPRPDASHGATLGVSGGTLTPTANVPAPVAGSPVAQPGYTSPSPSPGLPLVIDAPAILRQVGDGLRLMTQGARQSAEFQLSPAELGRVKVRMEIEGKAVRMYVTTENAGVRDLVAQGLDGLRRDLLAQGLQCQYVSVEVQPDTRERDRRERDPDRDDALSEGLDEEREFTRTPASTRRTRTDGSRIDLTA